MIDPVDYRASLPVDTLAAAKAHAANYYCDGEATGELSEIIAAAENGHGMEDDLMDVICDDLAAEAC